MTSPTTGAGPKPGEVFKRHLEDASNVVHQHMSLQSRVWVWMQACFGEKIARDKLERCHRFYEEATELVQAGGMSRDDAHRLVDYTYSRPVGAIDQEVGGVSMTLAALCLAYDLDMHAAGEREIVRVWSIIDKIRAKQAAKPHGSPLP